VRRSVGSLSASLLLASAVLCGQGAHAQSLLDISPGMDYEQVKGYGLTNRNLTFNLFDPAKLIIADTTKAFVPGVEFVVAFCPGSNYDGKVVSVVATKAYKTDSEHPDAAIQLVQIFHDLFQQMSGDKLDSVLGTRTETEQGKKMGYVGVSIEHLLKNGETWDLGIFNLPEPNIQAIQLQRSVAINSECKKQ
jgi:phage-related protein